MGETCQRKNSHKGGQGNDNDISPKLWEPMTETKNVKVVSIQPESPEYQMVEKHLKLKQSFQIIKIERIQNKSLFLQYCAKWSELMIHNKSGQPDIEQILFHGTTAQSVQQINETGFNRSFSGVNGTVYGPGVYFALDSSCSLNYAKPDSKVNRYMYRAKALAGDFISTDSATKYLPNKPGTKRPCDSGGNKKRGIYVIFHDAQVYPEYLITFRDLKQESSL